MFALLFTDRQFHPDGGPCDPRGRTTGPKFDSLWKILNGPRPYSATGAVASGLFRPSGSLPYLFGPAVPGKIPRTRAAMKFRLLPAAGGSGKEVSMKTTPAGISQYIAAHQPIRFRSCSRRA